MTKSLTECVAELAVLIGRARSSGLLSSEDTVFAAGCLAKLALSNLEIAAIDVRAAIAPVDLQQALNEVNH